jgi:predicted double-glycine peptidase
MHRASLMFILSLACALPTGATAIELTVPGGMRLTVPITSVKEARFKTTLRQQYDFSCGSAALATLLSQHYGFPVSEQQVFEQMYAHGDQQVIRKQGFSLLDMQRYLARQGFHADGFELPLHKLVEAKLPAIVLVSDKGYNHFVVVKGVSDGRVLLGDPSSGTRVLPLAQFEAIWSSKLLFVIYDYPGAVAFNARADWRAAPLAPLADGIHRHGLDLVTMPKNGPGDF